MIKKLVVFTAIVSAPVVAFAADNVGGCGWGSKLMAGNQGIAPQVLAVTTNGTFGNQTFGISSGTSGCTQDGVVHSNWKTAKFIGGNMNRLAKDISVGNGETLSALSSLMNVSKEDQASFNAVLKNNFASIFTSGDVTSEVVASNIRSVLLSNETLATYAPAV